MSFEKPNRIDSPSGGSEKTESGLEKNIEKHRKLESVTRREVIKAIEKNEDVFLGAGNYGAVLNGVEFQGGYVCMKFIWEDLQIIEGEGYSDENDDYVRGLKKFKKYFEEMEAERNKKIKDRNAVFVPQNSPYVEFKKQETAYALLKSSKIDCRVPETFLSGFDDMDDTDLMEDDTEEERNISAYSRSNFHVLIMEKVLGRSLHDIVNSTDEHSELVELFTENKDSFEESLLEAIQLLNDNGVKHGDINLRNVMMDNEGKPVIIDFGADTTFDARDDISDAQEVLRTFTSKLKLTNN